MKRAIPYVLVMGGAALFMFGLQIATGRRP